MQHECHNGSSAEYATVESSAAARQFQLEERLSAGPAPADIISAVVIGTLAGWNDDGHPLVDYPGNPRDKSVVARSTVPLNQTALGREVALMFVDGDPCQPLVIGILQSPAPKTPAEKPLPLSVEVDGEQVVFFADKDIVLR